ncbi:MAG: ribonuclease H-like domain-containing protein [Candidatus Nezhaarchaeales archaeon]
MVKLCFLDVESTGLEAESSFIVGFGVMEEDGSWSHVFAKSVMDEASVIRELIAKLSKYEYVVTWYGSGFDLPMLVARAIRNGLDVSGLMTVKHLDLYLVAKSFLRLGKYDLDSVCKFFGIPKRFELKGSDMPPLYFKALSGDQEALRMISDHCYDDLQGLRNVFMKLKPVVDKLLSGEAQRLIPGLGITPLSSVKP